MSCSSASAKVGFVTFSNATSSAALVGGDRSFQSGPTPWHVAGSPPCGDVCAQAPSNTTSAGDLRRITVKLRGRAEVPALGAEGARFLSARGAKQEAPHGPLQRLLDGMSAQLLLILK